MKKLFLILILFLTGCAVNTDFNKVCTYETKTTHLNDKTSIDVTYNSDDLINEAVVIKTYKALDKDGINTLKNIKLSIESYNTKYSDMDIEYYVYKDSDEEFIVKYKLDVQKLDNDVLKDFKLRKNSIKFFNKMREANIECEG
ncbi:MAG: hypothetical protein IKG27_04145 [Bacilli bacterium]|nr:hypothetical protein [Bacilli bacterium]